jgi:hypothetical protein
MRNQPGCQGVSDLDRIRLKVMNRKNPADQEEGYRAFRELA